jgi:serine/threonine-protein phosphatase 4 regulatory subunit 4
MSERDKLTLLHQAYHFLKNYNLKLPEPWYEVFEMLYCYDMHNSIRIINELTDIDAESLLK